MDSVRLRRRLRARLFGTTGLQWLWWGGSIVLLGVLLRGEFYLSLETLATTFILFGWAVLELTAWASVDEREVAWRGLFVTHRVPLHDVVDIEEIPAFFLVHGTGPQLQLVTRSGRRLRIFPSTWVGRDARREFTEAVRAAKAHTASPPRPAVEHAIRERIRLPTMTPKKKLFLVGFALLGALTMIGLVESVPPTERAVVVVLSVVAAVIAGTLVTMFRHAIYARWPDRTEPPLVVAVGALLMGVLAAISMKQSSGAPVSTAALFGILLTIVYWSPKLDRRRDD